MEEVPQVQKKKRLTLWRNFTKNALRPLISLQILRVILLRFLLQSIDSIVLEKLLEVVRILLLAAGENNIQAVQIGRDRLRQSGDPAMPMAMAIATRGQY